MFVESVAKGPEWNGEAWKGGSPSGGLAGELCLNEQGQGSSLTFDQRQRTSSDGRVA